MTNLARLATLAFGLPGSAFCQLQAQRPVPVFSAHATETGTLREPSRPSFRRAKDPTKSVRARDKTPFVLGGLVVGAIAGGFLYRRELDKIGGYDYGAFYSIPIYVGGGAAIGALLGYMIGSMGDPPTPSKQGRDAMLPAGNGPGAAGSNDEDGTAFPDIRLRLEGKSASFLRAAHP